jgi:predicted dehydrogenase
MCKKKGKVVLVGTTGMNIKREDMYAKELDLLMSTSYGPGRYDTKYEERGLDYPYAYVRWTENRNMSEYLRLLNDELISFDKLPLEKFPISQTAEAFDSLNKENDKPVLVILDYGEPEHEKLGSRKDQQRKLFLNSKPLKNAIINIALIGSGNFATGMHLPNIKKLSNKLRLYAVMNKTGYKGKIVAEQNGAHYVTTEYNDILNDDKVDLVLIATRHDSHSELALKSLRAGKNTFVEKPLAVNEQQLESINHFFKNCNEPPVLMVGFNRRFSKYAREIKAHTDRRINPLYIHYRMNAGHIPLDHWIHENGGRIIGEACHIIDLMTYFTGCKITAVSCEELSPKTDVFSSSDNKSIILKYEDGSIASIEYFAVGNNRYPKEYMEVHFDQKTIVLDNYKLIKGYGVKIKELSSKNSQKGQLEELEQLHQTLINGGSEWPIPLWDMVQTTAVSFLLK